MISLRRRGFSTTITPTTGQISIGGTVSVLVGEITQPPESDWPLHSPAYVSAYPGVGGYALNSPGGAGRGTGTTVIFTTANSGDSGGALDSSMSAALNWPTASFYGTPEYAARHAASPKVILPLGSGIVTVQDSIPNQTGTPPRPGFSTYYGQSAPNPGLILRGCNWQLNGGDNHIIWHMKSWMGDDATGLPAANRDCLSSGYGGGVTNKIVLINCEFQWSVDELCDFYRTHSEVSLIQCSFIEPLHLSTVIHPEDGAGVDHGFGPIIGGDTGNPVQPSAFTIFRCLFAHTTGRNPLTNTTSITIANNLYYNIGRPVGVNADGNAIQLFSTNDPTLTNVLYNGFIRGPNNRSNLVAISVSGSMPPGSQGYAAGNAQFGWTAASQNAFFTSSPSGYIVGGLIAGAIPSSWGTGVTGVLQWAQNPLSPSAAEWTAFVDRMERSVGGSPRWRNLTNNRIKNVFAQIRARLNGVAQTDQFVDTVAEAGGWPTITGTLLNPTQANAAHWHAPLPTGPDRDTVYTSGTFSNGLSRVGYTRLEAWAFEQHLYVMQYDTTAPSAPQSPVATGLTTTTIRITWAAATESGVSGLGGYRVYRSTTVGGTYTQVGADLSTSTLEYQDSSLSANVTRFYYVVAFDNAGNVSAASTIVSATTSSNPSSGAWADMYGAIGGLEAGISVAGRRYGIRGTTLSDWGPTITVGNGGQLIFRAGQSFDGQEPVIEFRPPTTLIGDNSQYCTILASNLYRGGLNNNAQINFRWLEYIGPRFYDLSSDLRPKWMGILASSSINQPGQGSGGRCGLFDQNASTGTKYFSITANTIANFNNPPEGFFADDGPAANKLIAIRNTANHSLNAPQTAGEWICLEQVVDLRQNRGNPFGRNAVYVWTRDRAANGRFIYVPLNYFQSWDYTRQYANTSEGLGAYFNGTATAHPDNYKLWSHCTMAANMNVGELIGPPAGF